MPVTTPIKMTPEEWRAEAISRFGPNKMKWRFVCPSCSHVASAEDWKEAGAPEGSVGFSCVGRYQPEGPGDEALAAAAFKGKGGPCNYSGGGLFGLNPVHVDLEDGKSVHMFAFAEATVQPLHTPGKPTETGV
ncbi:VVA0879 family protein [Polaromonas sp.]|uniref:VVA0879 family protein n=1 Tax=Polaromonas sp. TaxID=1869339 RepID=UPI00352B2E66